MQIQETLFGLQFRQLKNANVWHPDVSCYEVKDKQSGALLGYFYMDIIKRGNVSVHPSAHSIKGRTLIDGKQTPAVAMLMANFDAKEKDKPHTMDFDSVVTFFHEFGHVMHHMCNEANYTRFSGTSVERDFVEMPSTMLEHWMENYSIIRKMSKHQTTGAPIPKELFDRKISSL